MELELSTLWDTISPEEQQKILTICIKAESSPDYLSFPRDTDGMKFLGAGISKNAFQVSELVVCKRDISYQDYTQLSVEWRTWMKYETEEFAKFLCPQLAALKNTSGKYLLSFMFKAELAEERDEREETVFQFNEAIHRYKEKNRKKNKHFQLPGCLTWDIHRNNVGMFGGSPVVIDYGFE